MGKKIIGFLLTFIICIGALPMTSLADSVKKPEITSSSYVNMGKNSTYSIRFNDREDIIMAVVFLIEEVKSETETTFNTTIIDGKTYRLYAIQPVDLEKSKVSEGSWYVKNNKFEEIEKAPTVGKTVGLVIGSLCEGETYLTYSNIKSFKVPKDTSDKLTLKNVKVKKSAKRLTISATLKKGGKALKGKKLTFKFNGKKYSAKTNSKGVAKVTIKNTVLKKLKVGKKITYQVSYGKITVKKTVKVKK